MEFELCGNRRRDLPLHRVAAHRDAWHGDVRVSQWFSKRNERRRAVNETELHVPIERERLRIQAHDELASVPFNVHASWIRHIDGTRGVDEISCR